MRVARGDRLGRYLLGELLGSGGMGSVYRARDTVLARDVAVKVMPPELAADPEFVARFEREAQAVAALSHPNILSIHDFGTDNGTVYAVTELLEGHDLRSDAGSWPLPWREAVALASEAAAGLAAAHAHGIVHRDLKPENIFVTGDGRVKILDFGLARRDPGAATHGKLATTLAYDTHPGTVLGTPGYMAPEQARGEVADARTDVFALGCVLYELLTGRRAFPGASAAESLAAALRDTPPPSSSLVRGLPAEADRVLARCLAKLPAERYPSARELLDDLRRVAGASSAATVTPRPARRTAPKGSLAVLPFLNVGGDPELAYLAEGACDALIGALAGLPGLRVMARSTMLRFSPDAAPAGVGRELGVAAVLAGQVSRVGDEVVVHSELVDVKGGWRLWGGTFSRPLSALVTVHDDITREVCAALQLTVRTTHKARIARRHKVDREAYLLYVKGRYHYAKGSLSGLQKAREEFEQAIDFDPTYAQALAGLSDCYWAMGADRFGALPPREGLAKAKAAARRALEIDPSLGEAHVSLGQAAMFDWDWPLAEAELARAVDLSPELPLAHQQYATLLTVRARFDEAVSHWRKALELDPLSLAASTDLGWTLYCARRHRDAIAQCDRTLEMDAGFAQAMFWKGFACCAVGDAAAAVVTGERVVSVTGGVPTFRGALALALGAAGRAEEAGAVLADLQESRRSRYVPLVAVLLASLGAGDPEASFKVLDEACANRSSFTIGLAVYAFLDPLRPDPRFPRYLELTGLG